MATLEWQKVVKVADFYEKMYENAVERLRKGIYRGALMQKCRKDHGAIADACIRHRIGNDGFDNLLTFRAVIAMYRMFGNFRRNVCGNVFDDAFSSLLSLVECRAAVGTVFQAMCFVSIDDGRWASRAWMTGFGSRFFLAFFTGFFLKGGNGGGGSTGMSAVDVLCFKGESGKLQQRKDDDGFALSIERTGGLFIETVFQQGADVWVRRWTRRHRRVLYHKLKNPPSPISTLQTAE